MESNLKQDIVYALRKKGVAETEIPRLLDETMEQRRTAGDRFSVDTALERMNWTMARLGDSSGWRQPRRPFGFLFLENAAGHSAKGRFRPIDSVEFSGDPAAVAWVAPAAALRHASSRISR
ncbi:hypothetical protein [Arthrobacter sp. efr-133-R2A-120]|uniref:hypothetical protein n=1 Tax=Arthrobacter sp. efr-133-R2A-120 TaxID=3040277 RepID=UPI00254C2462|nr:hypothetical protein [Arthrobacter sp. efr-133-R2A-120]